MFYFSLANVMEKFHEHEKKTGLILFWKYKDIMIAIMIQNVIQHQDTGFNDGRYTNKIGLVAQRHSQIIKFALSTQ